MIDVATDLKNRFELAALWFFERSNVMHGVDASLPDKDATAVKILDALHDSVDVIPPSLIRTAEALRTDSSDAFERWLVHGMQVVGFGFYPADATEFVKALNQTVEREMESCQNSLGGTLAKASRHAPK
jgi:hypothetical protein